MATSIRPFWAFLAFLALAAAQALSCSPSGAATATDRHVILVIGDGMGYSTEVASSRYAYGLDEGHPWDSFPTRAWVATYNVDTYNTYAGSLGAASYTAESYDPLCGYDPSQAGSQAWPLGLDTEASRAYLLKAYTDSAAAATAMATGHKTDTGRLAWAPGDGASLETIAEKAKSQLQATIGLVTTVPFNHATPAAFVAHDKARSDYAALALSIIQDSQLEVVMGGGHPAYCPTYFSEAGLATLKASAAYRLVEKSTTVSGNLSLATALGELSTAQGLFYLGGAADGALPAPVPLSSPGSPGYTRDESDPSLSKAALSALAVLHRKGGSLFLMVEQGDIDWANHANNYSKMLGAMGSLDETVSAIVAYVDAGTDGLDWSNTLLIVTADHSTGLLRYPGSASLERGVVPSGYTYYSTGHANELVGFYAKGMEASTSFSAYPGAKWPGTTIMENTAIYEGMAAYLGLE